MARETIEALDASRASRPMRLTVLGATGSVGKSTLDIVGRLPDRFEIIALTAQSNARALAALARQHRAKLAVIGDEACLGELREALSGTGIRSAAGAEALVEAAMMPADCVMAAIVAFAIDAYAPARALLYGS
jgi:1-deoxy-D-xylulose-5-phosphate reductoisomerase